MAQSQGAVFPSETNEDVPGNAKVEVVPYVYTNSADVGQNE